MDRHALQSKYEDIRPYVEQAQQQYRRFRRNAHDINPFYLLRTYVLRVHTILILLWIWLLHWGELRVFEKEVRNCDWHKWERWGAEATPHHVAFVADPQLVDPHTYPGRPWPLSSLTVTFTDKYLKRSYRTLQSRFDPDTVYFLGDLFDGGREWSTDRDFELSDKRWKRYGMRYWLREYERFARIFFTSDQISGGAPERRDKTIVASLPGNHDLGFANGVQMSVRSRFQAFFGVSDRIDVIGNHSFVGLDTVSLSAKVVQGSSGNIWASSDSFLDNAQHMKREKTEALLARLPDMPNGRKFRHERFEPSVDTLLASSDLPPLENKAVAELPTVLLSHVPLYREPGTKCGPNREHWPPQDPNSEKDERNAIRVAGGYQYQNVLNKDLTKTITEKVGNVDYAFSGDDHDYCEVVHRAYPSAGKGIKEVTVKSLSWAMGVRRPGFVLASLWNPIDGGAVPIPGSPGSLRRPTLHSQLCLLPDQLSIFMQYGYHALLSVMVLLVHATIKTLNTRAEHKLAAKESILPLNEPAKRFLDNEKRGLNESSGVVTSEGTSHLSSRSASSRARSTSPGGYALPSNGVMNKPMGDRVGYYKPVKGESSTYSTSTNERRKQRGFLVQWMEQYRRDLLWVAIPACSWFLWLWRKF